MGEAEAYIQLRLAETLFHEMEKLENELGSGSLAFQERLTVTMERLHKLKANPALSDLYSPNESAHELQISQLQFLLLEYYLGMLAQKINTIQVSGGQNDRSVFVAARLKNLTYASALLDAFLDQCVNVELLKRSERAAQLSQLEQGRKETREDKIRKWQLAQEADKALQHVLHIRQQAKDKDDEDLEDIERECLFKLVDVAILKSMEDQAAIASESEMLETMVQMAKLTTNDVFQAAERTPPPQGQGIEVTHINPKMEMKKEVIRGQVFQPGHRLPTMSLEEYADRELADALARQENEKNAPVGPRRIDQLEEDGDEDNLALVDDATMRDRAWDDWKDANPRGIGNKKGSQY
ncbi:hypothetical protein H310_00809 [Aphanomyces invadans]|uniref:TAP42-like protein n=1 Tax=Aphanomyces invadans TaxID=157072 RepID=A0A024UX27_9STRA|nr:hypothetical protein H310_00809 [Aphanomyces invadans]ETW10525.1 hypothetical protein H310_00809 [Aphanomyces invadans]|eukprot:XP_008861936.1 hypothetical protein H310_00809 [Aphanomyces invadans]